jgi:hypothetical protein
MVNTFRAVGSSPRNVPDDVLQMVKEKVRKNPLVLLLFIAFKLLLGALLSRAVL